MPILTPNRRLATQLKQHAAHSNAAPCSVTPIILALDDWLTEYWNKAMLMSCENTLPFVLTAYQEQCVWRNIIDNDSILTNSFDIQKTAQMAAKANHIATHWQLWETLATHAETIEHHAFLRWASEFQARAKLQHWVTPSARLQQLASMTQTLSSNTISLYAINELSPLQQRLFNALTVKQLKPSVKTGEVNVLPCSDQQREIELAARFAKAQLNKGLSRIACVVPNLHECREALHTVFNDIFTDNTLFNISGGEPLATLPCVDIAFKALHGMHKPLPANTWYQLLTSPYFKTLPAERLPMQQLAYEIIEQHWQECDFNQLEQQYGKQYANQWFQTFIATGAQSAHTKLNIPSQWAYYFNQALTQLGWPHGLALNSEEYQQVQRYLACLDELCSLDHIISPISFSAALMLFESLCQNTLFQIETPQAPVQVLGMLEAEGQQFECLWVMGLTQQAWPLDANPNPFLPIHLQREHQTPNSSAERELAFSVRLTQSFAQSADQVIFSYSQFNNDIENSASSLLDEYPIIKESDITLVDWTSHNQCYFNEKQLEHFEDKALPNVDTDSIALTSGMLQEQALCPHRASARHRLKPYNVVAASPGHDALVKGILLHSALEYFWRATKNSQALADYDEPQLNQAIATAVQRAQYSNHGLTSGLPKAWQQLEYKRLCSRVRRWLIVERQRPAFTVHAIEQSIRLTLNNIPLSLRVDRIDELHNGALLIIDYKSGYPSTHEWLSEPLSAVQLPLYAITHPKTTGIAYASLHPHKLSFNGISQQDLSINGIKSFENWQPQLSVWQDEIRKLMLDFTQGRCEATPLSPTLCLSCDYSGLCRISK